MFNVGDKVRHVASNTVGTIVEIDEDTIYLEQANGVEVDFEASALVLEDAFQAKHDRSVSDDAGAHQNDPVYDAVIDNLYPALLELGQTAHAKVPPVPGVQAKTWNELSSLQKLNTISDVSGVAVKAWLDANNTGAKPSLAELQLSVLGKANG